jgi:hypothetical protein
MYKVFLISLFFVNVVVVTAYLVLSFIGMVKELSSMNFSFLLLYAITTNIVFGELILKELNGKEKVK